MKLTEKKGDAFIHAIIEGKSLFVKNLLLQGVDPNLNSDSNGWSALHFAAEHDRLKIGEMLIKHGAKVDVLDRFGCSPLYFAVDLEADSASQLGTIAVPSFSKMLLLNGADPYCQNHEGETPLDLARFYKYEGFIELVKLQ